jgi:carboxyl-terminal processing protease
MAGTLQDYDRGVVVGSRTYGKGLVQSVREMPYNSSMKLTTSKYYIPSGRCVQAIDYKNRDGMGRATLIADSLTHVFHTEAGREVRDGGGIRPDVEVKLDTVANITAYLAVDDVVFDYATEYYQKHPNLKSVSDFEITDEDYADFCQKVKNSDFKYDKQTEKALESLQKIAEFEGYLEPAKEEFEALKKKLTHNLDYDLEQNKKDIKQILSDEIIKRYFYQAGSVEQSLKYDPTLDKAVEILHDDALYKSILTIKK